MTAQALRPYQERAVVAMREAYRAGKRAPLLVLPTGGGKTTIASFVARKPLSRGQTFLMVAHRSELLEQARDRLVADGLGRVGIIGAGYPTMNAPAQVASIQTLVERAAQGLPPGDVVVYDEAHHGGAKGWLEVMLALRAKSKAMLGLTATPERGDGAPLGDLFDHIIPVCSVRELQALGFLVRCITYAPGGPTKRLSQDPVAAYLARTPGERAFVFAQNVDHAERLALDLGKAGVVAATIHAQTEPHLRRARVAAFRSQTSHALRMGGTMEAPPLVLVNVYTLTEGIDVPEASSCILARGCGHAGMLLQMVGRVMRPAPGKTHATLVDLRGCVHKLGLPEADRIWSLEGKAHRLSATEVGRKAHRCPVCEAMVSSWSTDRDGWRTCPECHERVVAPAPPAVATRKLHAMGALAPPEERARVLAQIAHLVALNGWKPGAVAARYKARFGDYPPWGDAARAHREAEASITPAERERHEEQKQRRAEKLAQIVGRPPEPAEDAPADAWQAYLDEQAACG